MTQAGMKTKAVESYSCLVLSYADLWNEEGCLRRSWGKTHKRVGKHTVRKRAPASVSQQIPADSRNQEHSESDSTFLILGMWSSPIFLPYRKGKWCVEDPRAGGSNSRKLLRPNVAFFSGSFVLCWTHSSCQYILVEWVNDWIKAFMVS